AISNTRVGGRLSPAHRKMARKGKPRDSRSARGGLAKYRQCASAGHARTARRLVDSATFGTASGPSKPQGTAAAQNRTDITLGGWSPWQDGTMAYSEFRASGRRAR